MQFQRHVNITLGALRRWLVAQLYDCLFVALLWVVALLWIGVPWAFFWALMAGLLQFIPHFGMLLALIGPAMAMLFSRAPLQHWFYFLGAYAVIAAADALILQPYLMRRQNSVPIWASILAPVALGIAIPFWGVLLAPPLLAVIYAFRKPPGPLPPSGEQRFTSRDEGVILAPERPANDREDR
jgi:predicted PurR-regulated permease PerM